MNTGSVSYNFNSRIERFAAVRTNIPKSIGSWRWRRLNDSVDSKVVESDIDFLDVVCGKAIDSGPK